MGPRLSQDVFDIALCDKVCQWLATGRWFSSKTPVFSTSKTDSRDIAEILLKVALNSINQPTVMGLSPLFKHSVSYSITNVKSMK
jgi:hypothetical protein